MRRLAIRDWHHSFRVYLTWVKMIWLYHLEYRLNAIVHSLGSIFWFGATLLTYFLIFRQIESLAGWTWQEILILYGAYNLWWGLMVCFFNGGLKMGQLVRQGSLDKFLLYPGKSFFYATMKFEPELLVHFLVGLSLFVYAWVEAGFQLQAINLLLFLILIANGLLIAYFVSMLFGITAFWFTENRHLVDFYWLFETLSKYPPSFFDKSTVLTLAVYSILPVVFLVAVPTEILIGRINYLAVFGSFLVTAVLGIISQKLWRLGLKNYTSVSR
jgi:ABC-2 type transport system permease protein